MNKTEAIKHIKQLGCEMDIVQFGGYDILEALKGHKCHCCLVAVLKWPWQRRSAKRKGFKVKPMSWIENKTPLKTGWGDIVIVESFRDISEGHRVLKQGGKGIRIKQ